MDGGLDAARGAGQGCSNKQLSPCNRWKTGLARQWRRSRGWDGRFSGRIEKGGRNGKEDEHESIEEDGVIPGKPKGEREEIDGDAVEDDPAEKEVIIPIQEAGETGHNGKEGVPNKSEKNTASPSQAPRGANGYNG